MKRPDTRRSLIIGIGAILGLVLIGGLIQMGRRQVDWRPTFTETQNKPYAASLLRERLGDLFPGQPVETVKEPAFEHLIFKAPQEAAYLFFNDELPLDDESRNALLDFVAAGNH
ncbi:MAG: DUF4350 domain-containing protein, partial [Bacteroidetes bacterium]